MDTKEELVPSEITYRRGYHQAVAETVRALREGATIEDLARWERELRAWRSMAGQATGDSRDNPPTWKPGK